MRRLSAIVLVAGAAVVVTAFSGGSAYAGEAIETRLVVSPASFVLYGGTDAQDDLTGCGAHDDGGTSQSASIKR
jgi:hypothetical protein